MISMTISALSIEMLSVTVCNVMYSEILQQLTIGVKGDGEDTKRGQHMMKYEES